MFIDSLTLEGFRNYGRAEASFSREVNVLVGDNAQGKTNLLEALYVLAAGRSFRARSDRELIGFGRPFALLKAAGESEGREKRLEMTLQPGRRRTVTVNGVKLKTASEISESFAAVLFCPEDLGLIRDGAAARRKLMDLCISQLRPRYALALRDFQKALEGKTRILRDFAEKPSLRELLEEYDYQVCRLSAELIHYRARFIERLGPEAARIHGEFSGGEALTVSYQTVKTVEDPLAPPEALFPRLWEHLQRHKDAEMASGLCLSGAHKDDLEIGIGGVPARTFASQGQTRTAALSLKLAERELLYAGRGEYPLLLLDDVLSELDAGRQDFILNRIGGGQVFITCCEDDRIAERTGGRVISIRNGTVL